MKAILFCLIQWYNFQITGKIEERLKNQLVDIALHLPAKDITNSTTASLNYAATVQTQLFSNSVIWQSLRATSNASVAIGLLIFLIALNPRMILVSLTLLILVGIFYFTFAKKISCALGGKMNSAQVSVVSVVEDLLNGLKQIKVNNYSGIVTKLAKNSARDYKNAMVKVSVLQQSTQPMFEFSAICIIALFILLNHYGATQIQFFRCCSLLFVW